MSEVIGLLSAIIAIIAVFITVKRNSTDYTNRKLDWETRQENRLTSLEATLAKMTPVSDRIVVLETQMLPVQRLVQIIEDSLLKQLIHNPLTEEEINALDEYHKHRNDPNWHDEELLLIGKRGLQRELKQLEDNPKAATESTLPYILTIAAIDGRLDGQRRDGIS